MAYRPRGGVPKGQAAGHAKRFGGPKFRRGQRIRPSSEREQRLADVYTGEGEGHLGQCAVLLGWPVTLVRRLIREPAVIAAITERRMRRAAAVDVGEARVDRGLAEIAFADVRQAFDVGGRLLPPHEWPPELARAVASVDVEEETHTITRKGETRTETRTRSTKIRLWSKTVALEILAKKLGFLRDVHLHAHFDHAAYLEAVWAKMAADGTRPGLPEAGTADDRDAEVRGLPAAKGEETAVLVNGDEAVRSV